jgi:sarcosine oxidase subunit alpha
MKNRLDGGKGTFINREKPIEFSFEGNTYQGYEGDTLASALAANGKSLLSRSFKYHRPRGLLTACGQDSNTLVQLPDEPNVLADRLLISQGLVAKAQHYEGSLENDKGMIMQRLSHFLPAGFYYRAFFRPAGIWEKFWAPIVRKKTGLGVVNRQAKSQYYDKQYSFFDVVVIGSGPAGLEAALFAARAGAKVVLVEENEALGGAFNYARFSAERAEAESAGLALISEVQEHSNIEVMTSAVCNGWYSDNWLSVIQGNRLYKMRGRAVVMAVGAIEQPAIFHNNDLPGIMQGSAAQRLINQYGVKPGETAVVLTSNEDGYGVALDLDDAGVQVEAIVDLRDTMDDSAPMAKAAKQRGLAILAGHAIYAAETGDDKNHLGSVDVRRVKAQGACHEEQKLIACDLLCMSTGYTPTYQLPCQSGASLDYDDARAMFSITGLRAGIFIAGSVNGRSDLTAVRQDGQLAAWAASQYLEIQAGEQPTVPGLIDSEYVNHVWPIFAHPDGKEFVDFDEDLVISDMYSAVEDGYEHIQLTKRYTTVGMGPSQGRHSALAVARLVAKATNKTVAEIGVTTARPPFSPEKLGVLAGRSFYPERHSAMHNQHLEMGAQMLQAGAWMRPAFYGPVGTKDESMQAESMNVRTNVGLVDVSTLGGIDVRGPDAAELIERMYSWNFKKQPLGKARYALLCNDSGVVIDDGVACRIHEDYFYVTATTGGVDRVYQNMLKWNAQWRLDADIANVTAAWCGANIAGPNSRKVIEKVCDDVDFSSEAFPYMGYREGTVAGISARLIRVGFVGELGYEIHVPQHCGEALWEALLEAGESEGIKPFGIEAQRLLRLEKGHIIISQDTDAMSTPEEINMTWAVGKKKAFFIGQRTIEELNKQTPIRKLAAFVVDDLSAPIPQESHLLIDGDKMTGRITSCYYSPTVGKVIGMAYVPPEDAAPGSKVMIRSTGGTMVEAKIVSLPFYDPENLRQEM